MATLQEQARALGDGTRHAIFRYVADAEAPVGVAELTEHLGLNHNAIRQHLAKLVAAGLLVESRVKGSGPGRPRLVYELDPSTESRWGVVGPYEQLSLLLTEVIRSGDQPVEVGRRASARHGARSATSAGAVEAMAAAMARLGFDPVLEGGDGGEELVLRTCPFAAVALADPQTVCSLHLGLAEGMAAGTDVAVEELVVHDPTVAGCRLRLRRRPPGSQGDGEGAALSGRRVEAAR